VACAGDLPAGARTLSGEGSTMKLVWLALALASIAVPAGAHPGAHPIQPGARITRPDLEPTSGLPYEFYRCTMSFIFRDEAGALYTGTTGEAQCADHIGARIADEEGMEFGTAVFQEFDPPAGSFTLIAIDPTRGGDVDPSVRFWGGPTGVAAPKPNDIVLFTGNGEIEGDLVPSRAGVLISYDDEHFTANSLAELGDSGAPVIDRADGSAIGMISDFGTGDTPPTTDDGPSISRILHDCAEAGFDLTLVTSPYTAP